MTLFFKILYSDSICFLKEDTLACVTQDFWKAKILEKKLQVK